MKNVRNTKERDEMKRQQDKRTVPQSVRLVMADGTDPEVSVTWFQPDERKNGGSYVTTTGCIKKVDELRRTLTMEDGTQIPIQEVTAVHSTVFNAML